MYISLEETLIFGDKLIDKPNWNRSKGPRNLGDVELPCKVGCWWDWERRGRMG